MANDLSLYVHIPFCKSLCLYCNFVTFAHKNKKIPLYIDSLLKEIKQKAPLYKNKVVETIYFGGGTPSLIDPSFIGSILHALKDNFSFIDNLEISIECNPESLEAERIHNYHNFGVTRLSLGIQSFDKKTLLKIARPHDADTIVKALEAIRTAEFKNFGADFIMGLPYQTLDSFKAEVKRILSYKPPHLSFYFLSYDTKKIDLFIKDCPTDEVQIEMYEYLIKSLRKAGYRHYEVSNFAQPGFECRHNVRYWEQKDYAGFGVGAHSIVDSGMWENTSQFEEYLEDPLKKKEVIPMDLDLRRMEYIMLRLRTFEGLNLDEYERQFGQTNILIDKSMSFVASGHLKICGRRLLSTEKGFLINDAIVKALI